MFRIRNRFTNVDVFHPRNGNQVTRLGFLNFFTLQTKETKQLGNPEVLLGAIQLHNRNIVADLNLATENPTNPNSANKVVVVQNGNLELQWFIGVVDWRWNRLDDRVKQWLHRVFLR